MNEQLHQRALKLITQQRVELLASDDELWLSAHLAECESCAAEAAFTSQAISALRSMPVDLPRNLAGRTQLRIRLRSEELREHGPANRLIWAVAILSWIFGLATAPLVWRGFAWAGDELHLPKLVWMGGVVLWWVVPAALAAGVILWKREWAGSTN